MIGPAGPLPPARVLVCDGETRPALAVVRSLGRRGHLVAVCSHRRNSLAGASRYAVSAFNVPDPLTQPSEFAAALVDIGRSWRAELVLPVTEQSTLALLDREIGPARVIGAPAVAFRRVSDKQAMLAAAGALGIAVPRTILVARGDAPGVLDRAPLPAVLKPARSVAGAMRHAVAYADTRTELARKVAALPPAAFPLLVQERLTGPGIGIFLLLTENGVTAAFAHERVREMPPAGGHAVYCRSIVAPPGLIDASAALLQGQGWRGVAMVEYKLDQPGGTPHLMEVNGRFWGSLQLAIDAGVDFPAILLDHERGLPPRKPPTWKAGLRLRVWWEDVDWLLQRLRHTPAALDLPVQSGGRVGAVLDFLRWSVRERLETLRLDDVRPFVVDTREWWGRHWRRAS